MEDTAIRKIIFKYTKKYSTNNPFELAECLKIKVFFVPLGTLSGFYKYMQRQKCIFINNDIEDDNLMRFVMAHELGHAVLHAKENCYFMDSKTLLNTSKIETQANLFAINLLVPDDYFAEHKNLTLEQFSRLTGYDKKLIKLKMVNLME